MSGKCFNVSSGTVGFDPEWGKTLLYSTEEEYYEIIREEENEQDDNR